MAPKSEKVTSLPDFDFPVFLDHSSLNDYDLMRKLPLDLFLRHEGHYVRIKRTKYTLAISHSPEWPRDTLALEITTWKDVGVFAKHYYGALHFPPIRFHKSRVEGAFGGVDFPRTLEKVELNRVITPQDIEKDSESYKHYCAGDMTRRFNTATDVASRALSIQQTYFPDFKILERYS